MKTELPYQLIVDLKATDEFAFLEDNPIFQFSWNDAYSKKNIKIDTSIGLINIELLNKIYKEFKARIEDGTYVFPINMYTEAKYKSLGQKLAWHEKAKNDDSPIMVKNIKEIPSAIENYFNNKHPEHNQIFFFETDDYGSQPYLITSTKYTPVSKYNARAYTEINFHAMQFDKSVKKSMSIYSLPASNTTTRTVPLTEIFEHINGQISDDELMSDYNEKLLRTNKLSSSIGEVYDAAILTLNIGSGYYQSYKTIDTRTDKNVSPIIVLDTPHFIKSADTRYGSSSSDSGTAIPAFKSISVKLPSHTIVGAFHLESHTWVKTDIDNITKHVFAGPQLMDKLIIDDIDKTLIQMLIEQSTLELEDIVSGKSGGSFILASGLPGTGKTLTAEVLAESIGLPLYTVQCSQLGLDPEDIEKKLLDVLQNAERWNAVLQIDEADVYIRERGLDLKHNAIVGAFLRILEKSRCIMFMTTNIDSIDDAIKSRATAMLRYTNPDLAKLSKIFTVLSEQFKVKTDFTAEELFSTSDEYEYLYSGRDIKSFMKLSKMRMVSSKIESLSLEDARMLLSYIK